jgi:hypothetical protein
LLGAPLICGFVAVGDVPSAMTAPAPGAAQDVVPDPFVWSMYPLVPPPVGSVIVQFVVSPLAAATVTAAPPAAPFANAREPEVEPDEPNVGFVVYDGVELDPPLISTDPVATSGTQRFAADDPPAEAKRLPALPADAGKLKLYPVLADGFCNVTDAPLVLASKTRPFDEPLTPTVSAPFTCKGPLTVVVAEAFPSETVWA